MRKIISFLALPWVMPLIGALLLAILVWFFGPLIAFGEVRPLESDEVRLVILLVIAVLWALITLWRVNRAHKANAAMIEGIAQAAAPEPDAGADEVRLLGDRMREALDLLKRSKLGGEAGGRKLLYQLPWYVIIGPPGAGKTTALVNSGLSFPLAEKIGKQALAGVGGTRHCDWWFTNQAVLIDTAGRYTTQDSQQSVDSAAWKGFLGLLKKHRPRQPINGVLVAVALSDLAALSAAERQAHALAIRQRLGELYDELAIRFPVYVLFTKVDLLAGFVEFFGDLGREEREQVWGWTFPVDDGKSDTGAVDGFAKGFDGLLERLNARELERLQQETDPARCGLIHGFPQQVASLRGLAQTFMEQVFQSSRYHHRPLLRGFYFTSGTQDGTPIDRVMSSMARSFGLPRTSMPPFSGGGRSYFLTKLLRDVVFGEASLVSANAKVETRRILVGRLSLAASVLAAVLGVGALTASYFGNTALIERTEAETATYAKIVATVPDPVKGPDLRTVLPALKALRALPTGYGERPLAPEMGVEFGLYQGEKLQSQTVAAYRRGLNYLFLPRLLLRLETQMREHSGQPDFLFDALQVYLMLGRQHAVAKERVAAWLAADWANQYPGPDEQGTRTELMSHLEALLEGDLVELPLDGDLVGRVRTTLRAVPTAKRIYALMRDEARGLPEWRVIDKAGPAAANALARTSGKPLSDGIAGFFTRDGFHRHFLPRVGEMSRQVAQDSWVLGEETGGVLEEVRLRDLRRDVLNLYYEDFAVQWDGLLADVTIAPFRSLGHAAEVLNVVAGPVSPLRNLMLAAADETTLTAQPKDMAAEPEQAAEKMAAKLASQTQTAQRLNKLLADTNQKPVTPGQPIEDRYRRLRDMVKGTPSQLDDTLKTLNDLYMQVNRVAAAGNQGGAALAAAGGGGGAPNPAQQLQTDASRLPQPVGAILASVARNSAALTVGGARAQINELWKNGVVPFCEEALSGRYPTDKGSKTETTLQDFGKVFGPKGLIDEFFATNLARFVDTSKKPWRWQAVDQINLGLSPQALAQFERAAAIRDSMFPPAAALPQVTFDLVPVSLDASATEVVFDVGGQRVGYSHGPVMPTRVQWPPQSGGPVSLSFLPPDSGKVSSISADGPWALLRILDQAEMTPGATPDRFKLAFTVGGRKAVFELRATSVRSVFSTKEVAQFRCPGSL